MAVPLAAAVLVAGLTPARAQTPAQAAPAPPPAASRIDLSPECSVPTAKLSVIAPMPTVKAALRDDRAVRVLVIGAATGGGSFSAMPSYPERLRSELGRSFGNAEVVVVHRTLSGEVGSGAAGLVRTVTAEVGPDLVVWQVGAQDALARVSPEELTEALDETIGWLRSHDIDAVLVNPQYLAAVGDDAQYVGLVRTVDEAARRARVTLVQRYEAMRHLAGRGRERDAPSGFALSALGKRCLAEHVARTIAQAVAATEEPAPAGVPSR
ncbi:MAG TPA: SGNH/GDSL hydrolase family protein [Salinarimonas sp.]|nr:SGNH/GDSL hydrolase family protein [Salinarimonas sp.]